MKMITKKTISAWMALLMLMLSFSVPAAADTNPSLTIDSVSLVKPGESATVFLHLSDLPGGIYVLQLAVEYDPDKLQLTSVNAGDVFSTVGSATINGDNAGTIYLVWDSIDQQITDDCTLLTMTFSTRATETCDALVSISETEDCILANWNTAFTPTLTPGTVHIEKEWAIPRTAAANFEGKIGLNYYLWLPDYVLNDPGAYALLIGESDTQRQMVSAAYPITLNGEQLYVFSYYLVANEIRDTIRLKLYDGNNNPIGIRNKKGTKDYTSSGVMYSLYEYCNYMKDNGSTATMRALAAAAMDYCTAAQLYFNYHVTDDLTVSPSVGNVQSTDMDQYRATLEGNMPDNVEVNAITAAFESDNSLRVYLSYQNNADPYSYAYSLDDETPYTLKTAGSTAYYVSVDNVPANHLGDIHSIGISRGQKNATVKCAVLTYARLVVKNGETDEIKTLGKALYLYYQAAHDHFGDR